jgi:LysR family glycine cleavage system transcriptional activator
MAAQLGPNPKVADLLKRPLVTINTEVQNWHTWFESAGVAFNPESQFMVVDTLAVALELALDNEAIALVNGPFVTQDLASGRLVRPVSHKALCPGEWGLISRRDMKENYRIKTFVDWVAHNAAQTDQALKAG